ncbi:MAG: ABC transporter ATP-binding protein/permease [Parvibaculum sp.]|uniref:ABC transporter ATP-binding protein n=1 Tax=Parvibaculum sp. TaxID=2024848 RepID=UPI0025ECAC2E|nr:ABC transporter ATP-binding protein [Parvibaculum sp.]MCE9648652.1 ABC transporter ATP-binding protein/permease [Parvibaculum sp.]
MNETTLPGQKAGPEQERRAPAPGVAVPPAELKTFKVLKRTSRDYLLPNWKLVFTSLVASSVVAASTGVLPVLIKYVFDDVLTQKNQTMLVMVALATIGANLFKGAASYASNLTKNYIGQKIISAIQTRMFARIVKADLAWVSGTHSGRFISSFMNDTARVREAVTMSIIDFTQNLLTVIALMGAIFFMNWKLALLACSVIPFGILYMRKLGKKTRKASRKSLEGAGDLSALISEALGGIRVVKAYGQEDREIERVAQTVRDVLRHMMRGFRAKAAASPLTEALSGFGIAGVIYFGGLSVIHGPLTSGELVAFISALMLAYQPLKAVANTQTVMQEGVAAAARVFPILDIEPGIVADPDAKPLRVTDGAVHFEHVSFVYGDGTPALDDISIDIPKGHTVALVGPSGGGKSTTLNLVPRFYDPSEGRITIDGQDIRDVTVASLRQASSLVTQDPFLFDDTVRANIAYGRPEASEAEIVEAARNAAAHDFIAALPEGYDTQVGEAGFRLSGGQRQRIAIARAMLKNAPILLLDEATSALDTASELQVQKALVKLMEGRTTLVIAHRLSTIKHADRIYVIENGRILEQGTHGELVAGGGLYAELSRTQFAQDEEEADTTAAPAPKALVAGE